MAKLHRQRAAEYGDDYKHIGKAYVGMFPRGVVLDTEDKFRRFSILVFMQAKLCRYAQNFNKGGHPDSLDDVAVYSQMLRELDDER